MPYPRRLRLLAWPLALGLRPTDLAPYVSPADLLAEPPPFAPAVGRPRMSVALLAGCVQRVLFGGSTPMPLTR